MDIENVRIVHFMPGRVRLRVQELKGAGELASHINATLGAVPGIRHVDSNSLTGSVLIEYDPRSINDKEAVDALSDALMQLFPGLNVPRLLAWLAKAGH